MKTLEEQLDVAGLRVFGCCERLSAYGPDLLQNAPLLQDFTPAEADILGASMRLIRAEPGQVMMREGEVGDWMMLVLKGTVDVTKRIPPPEAGTLAPAGGPAEPVEPVAADAAAQPAGADEAPADADADASDEAGISRVAVLRRGAAIGDMSMLDGEPRYASCSAIEAVEAAALGRHAVALLIRDHPAVGAKLLVNITQLMAQRLRNISNQLVRSLQKK